MGPHFSNTNKNGGKCNDSKLFWRSRGKSSESALLLYRFLLKSGETGSDKMDAEEVCKHHDIIKKYGIDDFKGYFKKNGSVSKQTQVCILLR